MSTDVQTVADDLHDVEPVLSESEHDAQDRHDHGDEIHLPSPSIAPLFAGIGVTLALLGLLAPLLGVIGVVILAVSGLKMARFPEVDMHATFLPQLGIRKLGMWAFLASEVMFFTALIGVFISFKVDHHEAFEEAHHVLSLPLATIGTTVLIVSSFAVVMALEAIQADDRRVFLNWMGLTVVFGVTFLSIQAIEWYELMHEGIEAGDIFGTAFFTTTGFHGLHVLGGVVWISLLMLRAAGGEYSAKNNLGIELFGLYWHFVDVVWIVLFTVIYLIN
jgi:heme/copper-type cytochrome/quinol oxidase subunit 3